MVTVFNHVSAYISADFVSSFPTQFHFDGLLNKICEDTGVTLSSDSENGSLVLEGCLESLLSVQNMLVSSHAVFGSNTTIINEVSKNFYNIRGISGSKIVVRTSVERGSRYRQWKLLYFCG